MKYYPSLRPILSQLFFFTIALTFILSSCKEEETATPAHPLAGTWVMESLTISDCTDPEENGSVSAICTSSTCSKVIMTREGAFTMSTILNSTLHEDTGTYLVMDDVLEICVQGGTSCGNVTYKLSNNNTTLSFTDVDGDSGCKSITTYKKL